MAEDKFCVAILADIHGNSLALQAVLEDIQAYGGVNEYWCLGDYVALGHDPLRTLELLEALPRARFVRGNTDHYVTSDVSPGPTAEQVKQHISLLERYVRLARTFAWTAGALGASGWLPWLEALPLEMRTQLPDGTRVLAVHAAPGLYDGDGIHPATTDEELSSLVSGAEAGLVLVGHTHLPFDRQAVFSTANNGVRVVNPGSVSNPFPPDLRACYAWLEADRQGYRIELRRVDYDRQAVIEAVQRLRHPSQAYISGYMRGENKPPWVG